MKISIVAHLPSRELLNIPGAPEEAQVVDESRDAQSLSLLVGS